MGLAEVEVMLALLARADAWAQVVKKARAEGRAVSEAEIDAFAVRAEESDEVLQQAIAKAKAEGR